MTIMIGDRVTWRSGKSTSTKNKPLGIANCIVLEFGKTDDGKEAVRMRLPPPFDQEACGLVADLEPAA